MGARDRGKRTGARRVLAALPALVLPQLLSAGAEFRQPPPLARIVGTAEAIVTGTIRSVADRSFRLSPSRVVDSDKLLPGQALTVARERRFRFEPRWAPYEAGQTVLVFLSRDGAEGRPGWHFAARPEDSEWPVAQDTVYFHNRFIEGLPMRKVEIDGHRFPAQALPAEDVLSAFRQYRACYRWTGDSLQTGLPERTCPRERVKEFASRTPLHRQLIRETAGLIDPDGT